MNKQRTARLAVHLALLLYTALAIGPILLIVMNSFKARKAIFGSPLSLPDSTTFSLIGYDSVLGKADFGLYFINKIGRAHV